MDKLKIGTCWLDGCSGCHMSLLDMDEGIVAVLRKADIVFGPLVDAQEWPEGVDVAVIEGAVSSQDDLKLAEAAAIEDPVLAGLEGREQDRVGAGAAAEPEFGGGGQIPQALPQRRKRLGGRDRGCLGGRNGACARTQVNWVR